MKLGIAPWALCGIVLVLLAACVSGPQRVGGAALDPLAERFVKLTLQIGLKEEGYVDAYHGPPAWEAEAKAAPLPLEALKREAALLERDIASVIPATFTPLESKRRAFLRAHVSAARFRLRMIEGHRAPFAEEARALFAVRPPIQPLNTYAPLIAKVETVAPPGPGTLAERVAAFRKRYEIPPARLRGVIETAIAECRRRTLAHIPLPANEKFELEFVTGKSWSGYNWFKGDAHSLIQINTDLPVTIDRALDLGCHEGYPGHHVHNILMEKLYKERGWVEFAIWPLFAPIGFIAEGTANAGIDLAFPGDEKLAFETRVLYPLAGLDPASAPAYAALTEALSDLRVAEYTVADAYLAGRIDRATAIAQLQQYQLVSPERAAKRVDFMDTYRSYIINYGLGQVMAEERLAQADTAEARWAVLRTLLGEPTLPSDLGRR